MKIYDGHLYTIFTPISKHFTHMQNFTIVLKLCSRYVNEASIKVCSLTLGVGIWGGVCVFVALNDN